jgi:WD40 repeat protein
MRLVQRCSKLRDFVKLIQSRAHAATRTRTLRSRFTAAPGAPTASQVKRSLQLVHHRTLDAVDRHAAAGCGGRKGCHPHHPYWPHEIRRLPSSTLMLCVSHFVGSTASGLRRFVLQGHGRSINDLRFLPTDPNMLLSCSSDESCRLWNVVTLQLAVIFGGWHGHRSAVLSLDVHLLGRMFASCGMDNRLGLTRLLSRLYWLGSCCS